MLLSRFISSPLLIICTNNSGFVEGWCFCLMIPYLLWVLGLKGKDFMDNGVHMKRNALDDNGQVWSLME